MPGVLKPIVCMQRNALCQCCSPKNQVLACTGCSDIIQEVLIESSNLIITSRSFIPVYTSCKGAYIIKKGAQWIHAKCFVLVADHEGGTNKCCRCLDPIDPSDQVVGQYGAVRGWFHHDCLALYEEKASAIASKAPQGLIADYGL